MTTVKLLVSVFGIAGIVLMLIGAVVVIVDFVKGVAQIVKDYRRSV